MEKLLLNAMLDIECYTWGSKKDKQRREEVRQLLNLNEDNVKRMVEEWKEFSIVINCYLKSSLSKDIDNLAKTPIDAIFFSAKNESGYKQWESKITSLTVKKIQGENPKLEIILYGKK